MKIFSYKTLALLLAGVLCSIAAVAQQQAPQRGGQRAAAQAKPNAPTTLADGHVKLFIPYTGYTQEENDRIVNLFTGLRVSDVADGLDVVGLADVGIVSDDIKPLWKDTETFAHRAIGIAVTVRYLPTNKRELKMDAQTVSRWYADITSEPFQDQLFPGSILVIDAMEDGESRTIGSSNIMGWQRRGMRAVITTGGLADTDEIIHNKVPVYNRRLGRAFRPGRNEVESVNRPVVVGGVMVRPGDVIVADGDGIVVVPREHAEAVAKASLQFLDNVGLEAYRKAHPGFDPKQHIQ